MNTSPKQSDLGALQPSLTSTRGRTGALGMIDEVRRSGVTLMGAHFGDILFADPGHARGNFPNVIHMVHTCVSHQGCSLNMTMHDPEWTNMFVRLGFKKEWLEHYGSHFEFEKLDKARRFNEMMETLETVDDNKKCFLLHVVMCGYSFWNITSYSPFIKLLEEHNRVYSRLITTPTSCGASAA